MLTLPLHRTLAQGASADAPCAPPTPAPRDALSPEEAEAADKATESSAGFFGSMLFQRSVSGTRAVAGRKRQEARRGLRRCAVVLLLRCQVFVR